MSPEVYEREKKKFEEMMDETRNMAAITLREEFADIIAGLVDKLNSNSGSAQNDQKQHVQLVARVH